MGKTSSERTNTPKTIGPVKVEWNPLDYEMKLNSVGGHEVGAEGKVALKARCMRCWGPVEGRFDDDVTRVPDAIRCRVCGRSLEGEDAKEEHQRMSDEDSRNMFNMALGLGFKYRDDAVFLQKWFPYMDRQSESGILERVKERASEGAKDGWLTRSGFPAGSAGFLFLQAKAVMAGIERLPRELSITRFSDVDVNDDGSATVYLSKKRLGEHTKTTEYELMRKLGSTMTIGMMSAFACELAMKAIRLTCMDEARKNHDLWKLYRDLPTDSKRRIRADFDEVELVLKSARRAFDRWRYFEANAGGHGMSAMINTQRAFDLAKAARVIFDEAEMVGLGYSVHLDATQRIREDERRRNVHVKHDMKVRGTEAPPVDKDAENSGE